MPRPRRPGKLRRLDDEAIIRSDGMLSTLVFGFNWVARLEIGGDGEALLREHPDLVLRAWGERRQEAIDAARERRREPWAMQFDSA